VFPDDVPQSAANTVTIGSAHRGGNSIARGIGWRYPGYDRDDMPTNMHRTRVLSTTTAPASRFGQAGQFLM
jgi:hypothetical protein